MSKVWTPKTPAIIHSTEELLARLREQVAREHAILPGLVVVPARFITPGSQLLTSGTSFVIPEHNQITFELVGGGSGGWASNGSGLVTASRGNGGATTIASLSLTANGGNLSSGGTASGGSVNETGRPGGQLSGSGIDGQAGGGAGGTTIGVKGNGGSSRNTDGSGNDGSLYGGGGGGARNTGFGVPGGGGGGYLSQTYTAGSLTVGASLTYAIGAGGSGAFFVSFSGGAGRQGAIQVTWS